MPVFSMTNAQAQKDNGPSGNNKPAKGIQTCKPMPTDQIAEPAKLKVEIVAKPDPTDTNAVHELLTELEVRVALSGGLDDPPPANTKSGTMDFGSMPPGEYTVRVDLTDADQNKFDFVESNEQTVKLRPGDDKTLRFEVEPLYRNVQFIGHCLLTIPEQVWTGPEDQYTQWLGENSGNFETLDEAEKREAIAEFSKMLWPGAAWKAKYNGCDDDSLDIEHRLEFVGRTLDLAEKSASRRDDVLKVFVLPECFFLGKHGGYRVADLDTLLSKLRELVKDSKWRHWVFAFGTVNGIVDRDDRDPDKAVDFFNIAPVIRGGFGEKSADDYTRLIQKVKFSAELVEAADLVDGDEKTVTSTTVHQGFGSTENEQALGRIIKELLAEPEPTIDGRTISDAFDNWADVKNELELRQRRDGMTSVVRDVRSSKINDPWRSAIKKVLEAYIATRPKKAWEADTATLLRDKARNFSFEECFFHCGRKPGPWLQADDVPRNRQVRFGLEICADHSEGRLAGSGGASEVDIHLIPSAGMTIDLFKVVAISNGYVFNCDGWNAAKAMLPRMTERKAAQIKTIAVEEWPPDPGHNPLLPHSELLKVTATRSASRPKASVSSAADGVAVVPLEELKEDAKSIFWWDAGELHIYPEQPLPGTT